MLDCATLGLTIQCPAGPNLSLCSSRSQVWLPLAPMGGFDPPSLSAHRLPVLNQSEPCHAYLWHTTPRLQRWVVSLHLRSFLTASLCYTLLHLAFPRFAMVCHTPFVPVGGIAPPSVIPHWLPVLSLALLYYAKTSFTYLGNSMFRGGGGFRSRFALSHRLPLLRGTALHYASPGISNPDSALFVAVGSIALPSVIPHRLPLLYSAFPSHSLLSPTKPLLALFSFDICASGWYRPTFGLSSLAPFAELYLAKPNLAKRH